MVRSLVQSEPTQCLFTSLPAAPALPAQDGRFTEQTLSHLTFRSIGSAVTGGRIHDVEARPGDPSTIYVASASGGIRSLYAAS